MKYVIKVSKNDVVNTFVADIKATKASAIIEKARELLEQRGLSEILLSVKSLPEKI